jgi:ribosomal protein S18 acetylase RimI-like enzyme
MIELKFKDGELTADEQHVISAGFAQHTTEHTAPSFDKKRINWLAYDDEKIIGALTADILWDWIYVDELWVDATQRGGGLGKRLMDKAENYAATQRLTGLWLWTQSWQAAEFYKHLGYEEFARFPDFPKGHFRIGFRKQINIVGT